MSKRSLRAEKSIKDIFRTTTQIQVKNYRYSTVDKIGIGYSGVVYKGVDDIKGNEVAIKIIDNLTMDSEVKTSLLEDEMKIAPTLVHPNIVQTFECFTIEKNTYIVSEYCSDGSLKKLIEDGKIESSNMVYKIINQILLGLQHLTSLGIVHRDIKPANVFLHKGIAKLGDFGFSRRINKYVVEKFHVGSPLYMAPEVQIYRRYSHKSDIWAAGVIFYELLHGKTPFTPLTIAQKNDKNINDHFQLEFRSGIVDDVQTAIKSMLMTDFNERFGFTELLMLLRDIIKSIPSQKLALKLQKKKELLFQDYYAQSPSLKLASAARKTINLRRLTTRNETTSTQPTLKVLKTEETESDTSTNIKLQSRFFNRIRQNQLTTSSLEKPQSTSRILSETTRPGSRMQTNLGKILKSPQMRESITLAKKKNIILSGSPNQKEVDKVSPKNQKLILDISNEAMNIYTNQAKLKPTEQSPRKRKQHRPQLSHDFMAKLDKAVKDSIKNAESPDKVNNRSETQMSSVQRQVKIQKKKPTIENLIEFTRKIESDLEAQLAVLRTQIVSTQSKLHGHTIIKLVFLLQRLIFIQTYKYYQDEKDLFKNIQCQFLMKFQQLSQSQYIQKMLQEDANFKNVFKLNFDQTIAFFQALLKYSKQCQEFLSQQSSLIKNLKILDYFVTEVFKNELRELSKLENGQMNVNNMMRRPPHQSLQAPAWVVEYLDQISN